MSATRHGFKSRRRQNLRPVHDHVVNKRDTLHGCYAQPCPHAGLTTWVQVPGTGHMFSNIFKINKGRSSARYADIKTPNQDSGRISINSYGCRLD